MRFFCFKTLLLDKIRRAQTTTCDAAAYLAALRCV
jgi:hypothetical protein